MQTEKVDKGKRGGGGVHRHQKLAVDLGQENSKFMSKHFPEQESMFLNRPIRACDKESACVSGQPHHRTGTGTQAHTEEKSGPLDQDTGIWEVKKGMGKGVQEKNKSTKGNQRQIRH